MLLEVPVFSKFLHATALLYPSQVQPSPLPDRPNDTLDTSELHNRYFVSFTYCPTSGIRFYK